MKEPYGHTDSSPEEGERKREEGKRRKGGSEGGRKEGKRQRTHPGRLQLLVGWLSSKIIQNGITRVERNVKLYLKGFNTGSARGD